jgi:carotenoid isomerooxygenase
MPLVEKSENSRQNLVTLENSSAEAFKQSNGSMFCKPEVLCDAGCELSRINYEKFLGRDYQFFYAVSPSADSNLVNLVKVDVKNKTNLSWGETNCYPSEPIFLAAPGGEAEDEGVVLASMVWGSGDENRVGLVVLDAKTMVELGRCEFDGLPGPVPKCFHGWFAEGK